MTAQELRDDIFVMNRKDRFCRAFGEFAYILLGYAENFDDRKGPSPLIVIDHKTTARLKSVDFPNHGFGIKNAMGSWKWSPAPDEETLFLLRLSIT